MKTPLPALLLGVLLAGCASASRRGAPAESVEAEGWAPDLPADVLGTRRRAVIDAQRRAVEAVTGLWLSARTEVDRAVTVDSKLRALSKGAIKRYEILEERREEGFLKVRIRALVSRRVAPEPGSSVMLDIKDADLAEAVAQAFSELGFTLVERDPDLLVKGTARTSAVRGSPFPGFASYRASVDLRAGRASGRREASAMDASRELAREKAVKLAAKLAAQALIAQWSRQEGEGLTAGAWP